MKFHVLEVLKDSLILNRMRAFQWVLSLTVLWALMCLPFPFLEGRGYSLTTVSERGEGLKVLSDYGILSFVIVSLAIYWHQQVLLNGETLRNGAGRRLFAYGFRWLGFLFVIGLSVIAVVVAAQVFPDSLDRADARSFESPLVIVAIYAMLLFAMYGFFRGWLGLVAVALDEPKMGILASIRNTRYYRVETLLFSVLLVAIYGAQVQLDQFLLSLGIDGENPISFTDWVVLFLWGCVWSLPAALVLFFEVAFLTSLYAKVQEDHRSSKLA